LILSFLETVEQTFSNVAAGFKLIAEISSVALIGVGLAVALFFAIQALLMRQKKKHYLKLRLALGRFLVVALEFQLAADIIGTAIAPSWAQIGQLAAIALIRTFLSYFLNKEIEVEERETVSQQKEI
jgi:uncharacterized membrane protein